MKKRENNRVRAQTTVFLSLIMLCIFSLLFTLVESARTAGAQWYINMAAGSAMDSIFSQYHKEIWDRYRIFMVEYENEEQIVQEYESFLSPYLEQHNWYPFRLENLTVERKETLVEKGGAHFQQQIIDYMTLGVWNLDFTKEEVLEVESDLEQAEIVTQVAEKYEKQGQRILQIESILEEIGQNLKEQEKEKKAALGAVKKYREASYQKAMNRWLDLVRKIPHLVAEYEKEADRLGIELEENRKEFNQIANMKGETKSVMEGEILAYEAYIKEDGVYRKEITALTIEAQLGEGEILELKELAEQIQERIEKLEEREDEEEDVSIDYRRMWQPVEQRTNEIVIQQKFVERGVADQEKKKLFEWIIESTASGILTLVVPQGVEISKNQLDLEGALSKDFASREDSIKHTPWEQLLRLEYMSRFFASYEEKNEENTVATYEVEYLISGEESDDKNLEESLMKLIGIRHGINLMHVLTDTVKRQEADALAALIVGATPIAPFVFVVSFLIMNGWAMAESIVDIKQLLKGSYVELIKSRENWNLSLQGVLQLKSTGYPQGEENKRGISYHSWLKVLLLLEDQQILNLRMLDLIQMNIRMKEEGFLIEHGVYLLELRGEAKANHLFFKPKFMETIKDKKNIDYLVTFISQRRY